MSQNGAVDSFYQRQGRGTGLYQQSLSGLYIQAILYQQVGKRLFHRHAKDTAAVRYHEANMAQEKITPLAQQLAEENGLDWRKITGSGPGGKVLEGDVLEYLAHQLAGSAPSAPPEPPAFDIDLEPQPPLTQPAPSVFAAWPAEPLAEDQPLIWGKPGEPPITIEESPEPVSPPVVQTIEPVPPPVPEPVFTPPVPLLPDWQPVVLWQRWIPLEAARQAAQALGQAWGEPVHLHHLLLRAAQMAGGDPYDQGRVLRGELEGDRLLAYPLPEPQSLRSWVTQSSSVPVAPQPEDWVVLYLGEGPVDLASGPATQMICLGQEHEGWAPLACTGPWKPQTAQNLLETVENYLRQPVLLV